jgi:hypothetical protein
MASSKKVWNSPVFRRLDLSPQQIRELFPNYEEKKPDQAGGGSDPAAA